ncbi:pyridoxal phosphate-dependent aminotransferase [Ruegeria atlantica]|uniref:pyridoxal phosphate-dependent aminotransferase n=1 Tax=Ruegeria atlantica TaxID=81569 RepID=UPI00147A7EC1|nr:pyridoxal phosphate-dependent aminotransferase [Ruegeria atlantica]
MSEFRKASRIDAIGVSQILQIGAKAAQMKRDGRPVIILGAGEPDFDTPDNVKDAAIAAINGGDTKYTALDGTPELKRAIQAKFKRDNDLDFDLSEITVASGAKQILFNAFMASLEPGDEVIIPTPYWVSYSDIVAVAGGVPVLVPCSDENGFRLTADALRAAVTDRTRWVLFNSPSNPSGAAYRREDYQPLCDLLLEHPDIWIMADDMYEHIVYNSFEFITPAQVEPRLKDRTLTINGVSKAYAMTGWRIGYAGGPQSLIKAMAVIQSQSTSCPSSVSQAAAVAALTGTQEIIKVRALDFQARRDLVVAGLNAIEGINCPTPEGAFYTFANCAGVLNQRTPSGRLLESDADFCDYLLEDHDVAVVPGSAFGLSPFFRISYATSTEELQTAITRISDAISQLAS